MRMMGGLQDEGCAVSVRGTRTHADPSGPIPFARIPAPSMGASQHTAPHHSFNLIPSPTLSHCPAPPQIPGPRIAAGGL